MGAKAQTIYYPAASVEDVCNSCYVSGESSDCKPDNGSSQNSIYCGTCNVDCNTSQAYCDIGHESITSHGNVGSFSGFGANVNDLIHANWTVAKWNELHDLYLTANNMGLKSPQGASLSFSTVSNGNLYTSKLYNEFSTAASAFGSSTPSVNPEDLITVGRSKALETGFANGKFNSSVCDICNAGTQHNCGYNCNCNYNCNHNCNYNCKYDCSYDCSYDCDYDDSSADIQRLSS